MAGMVYVHKDQELPNIYWLCISHKAEDDTLHMILLSQWQCLMLDYMAIAVPTYSQLVGGGLESESDSVRLQYLTAVGPVWMVNGAACKESNDLKVLAMCK